jgi:predicted ATPase/class 3 adenylate cyclase
METTTGPTRAALEAAIRELEAQRALLGDDVTATSLAALQARLAALDAEEEPAPPAGAHVRERRLVTVLFADLCDFREQTATSDPEDLQRLLDAYLRCVEPIVAGYAGAIEQSVDDTLMAVFGLSTTRESDPENAVHAALAMRAAVAGLSASERPGGEAPLALRAGINTGPALVSLGETGGRPGRFNVLGDTVNVASRIQTAAGRGEVLISHETYRHVRGAFSVRPLAPLSVKGKREPLQVYRVHQPKARTFRVLPRGAERIETPLVGRAAELGRLQAAFLDVCAARRARLVTVSGDAGIGKSRLLYEFTNWIEQRPERLHGLSARADERLVPRPYALLRDLFAFHLEIRDGDPAALARAKLERGVVEVLGPAGAPAAALITQLIGLDGGDAADPGIPLGGAGVVRERGQRALAQFVAALAADAPVVICLEDLQWADDESLDACLQLLAACAPLPLLIVAAARPALFERRPDWAQPDGVPAAESIALVPLGAAESGALVDALLTRVEALPAEIRGLIVRQAEGYPYYIEEFIQMLIEDGVIRAGGERWQAAPGRLARLRLPATLRGVLQARLDSLAPAERELLQRAAIVGRVFWDQAVTALGAGDPAGDARALTALAARDLIVEHEHVSFNGARDYAFRSALLHEVTYETVLRRPRQRGHALAAGWLVASSGERAGEYAGLIGEHYERAGDARRAAEWYARAGRQAAATDAPAAAVDYTRKALALQGDAAPGAIELEAALGTALVLRAEYEQAAAAFMRMQSAARAAGRAVDEARGWNGLSWVRDRQADYQAGLAAAEQAERIAREAGADHELVWALFRRGHALFRLGDLAAARALAAEADTLGAAVDARPARALSLKLLGLVHSVRGEFVRAQAYQEQSLALFRALGERWWIANLLNNLGETARRRGNYARALAVYDEELELLRELGNRDGELVCLHNRAGARVGLGDYAGAEHALRAFLGDVASLNWPGLAESYTFLAAACLGQGKLSEALAAAERARALAAEPDRREFVGAAWRVLGEVRAALAERSAGAPDAGELTRAREAFAASLQFAEAAGDAAEAARTRRAWARLELACGEAARGAALRDEAEAAFVQLGMEQELARERERDGERGLRREAARGDSLDRQAPGQTPVADQAEAQAGDKRAGE